MHHGEEPVRLDVVVDVGGARVSVAVHLHGELSEKVRGGVVPTVSMARQNEGKVSNSGGQKEILNVRIEFVEIATGTIVVSKMPQALALYMRALATDIVARCVSLEA